MVLEFDIPPLIQGNPFRMQVPAEMKMMDKQQTLLLSENEKPRWFDYPLNFRQVIERGI